MSITLIGTPQPIQNTNGADGTATFNVAPQQDDYTVLVGGHFNRGPVGPVTAGYTAAHSNTSSNPYFGVWYKKQGATPDTTVTAEGSGNAQDGNGYLAFVLRGVDGTTPEDVAAAIVASTDPAAITTITNGAWVVVASGFSGSADNTPGTIAGYSGNHVAFSTDTNRMNTALAYLEKVTAGVEDPPAWSGWVAGGAGQYSVTVAFRPASSGTTFTQSVAGSITPTSTVTQQTQKLLTGSIAPSAALIQQAAKLVAGSIVPSAVLLKRTDKLTAGAITPSGAASRTLVKLLSVAGSIVPAGVVVRQVGKALSGTVVPSGLTLQQTRKTFVGSIVPTGAVSRTLVKLLSVAGTIVPTGVTTRRTAKLLVGTTSPAGALMRRTNKTFSGSTAPAGVLATALVRLINLVGSIIPTGAISKRVAKSLGGNVVPTGALLKLSAKAFAGSVGPTGALLKQVNKVFGGSVSPAGDASHVNVTAAAVILEWIMKLAPRWGMRLNDRWNVRLEGRWDGRTGDQLDG